MVGDSEWRKGLRVWASRGKWSQSWYTIPLWAQLLCLLGESFEEFSQEVCGAVVNIRTKGDKIAVWTSEAENQAGVMHIG